VRQEFPRAPRLCAREIAKDDKATNGDRIRALDVLGKYGGLLKTETETQDATLEELIRDAVESEQSAA
jgi:hypothetical protein